MDIAALKTEIDTDPAGLNYKEAGGAWKEDAVIAGLLNDPANGATVFRTDIPMSDVYAEVDWPEIAAALSDAKRHWFQLITSTTELDADSQNIRDALSLLFPASGADAAPNTRAAVLALIQKQGSRAEVLWGDGTTITAGDVGRAANA